MVKLRKKLARQSVLQLYQKLSTLDKKSAQRIGKHKRRLIRALEIIKETGEPIPSLGGQKMRFPTLILGINAPRDLLYQRIDERVDERIKQGMIKEVRLLIESGVSKNWLKNLGLEYRYITEYLEAKYTRPEMIQQLKFAIHHFARRQATWFRRYPQIKWLHLIDFSPQSYQKIYLEAEKLINNFLKQ